MARRDITGAVDFVYLETYAAGDAVVIGEVLDLFREQSAMWTRLLDPSGETEGWRDGSHTLKGASLGIGAFQLAEICDQAEQASGRSELERMVLLERLRNALDAVLTDIAAYTHERALQALKTPKT
jgi:HPt (histidine-containing phosphotransfer) domain-containing protein